MVSRTVTFITMAIGTLFSYVSIFFFVYLFVRYAILRSQTSMEVQDVLKFYIVIEIINGSVVCFSLTHSCIIYSIDDPVIYVTPLLYWDLALRNLTVVFRPLAIFMLGLERLLIILFPTTAEYKRKIFSFFVGIILIIIFSMVFLLYRIIPSIPTEIYTTTCISFNCIGKLGNSPMFFIVKTILGFMDFILGIILLIALSKRYKIMNITRIKNKNILLVMLTLFITIILNFLPNLLGVLFIIVNFRIILPNHIIAFR